MSNTDLVRLYDLIISDNFRSSIDVGYSHCSGSLSTSVLLIEYALNPAKNYDFAKSC